MGFTQQFTHNRVFEGDYWYLANKKQEGLKHYYNDKEQGSHSITSFFNDISKLKEGTFGMEKIGYYKIKIWE